jgi:DNA polymerase III delta subunit
MIEPKQIQKELDELSQGNPKAKLRFIYWIVGTEQMKIRELLKRIRKVVLKDSETGASGAGFGFFGGGEVQLDGQEVSVESLIEETQTLSFDSSQKKLIVVKQAHLLKEAEGLMKLFSQDLSSECVCVFISKDLDQRKKLSKVILEKVAVIPCEEVQEIDKEAWILYLAKRRHQVLEPQEMLFLRTLDPWNLDCVDQELEKLDLLKSSKSETPHSTEDWVVLNQFHYDSQQLLEAWMRRDRVTLLKNLSWLSEHPEEALPLMGLMAWNFKMLTLACLERSQAKTTLKLSGFILDRLRAWVKYWKVEELVAFQKDLAEIDFSLKQTQRNPLGLWTELALKYTQ